MDRYEHLRKKAIILRENGYSLTDICKRLNKEKSTVYYWIKNIKIKKINVFLKRAKYNAKKNCIASGKAVRKKYEKIHENYKNFATDFWESTLKNNVEFKMFLMYYACEGDRRSKWCVGLCNSDPTLMQYCEVWFKKINIRNKPVEHNVQLHVDQNENEVKTFWKKLLNVEKIKTKGKSNSGKMSGRNWNSKYGVLHIRFYDSYLKTMLNTWITLLKEELLKQKFEFNINKKVLPSIGV